MSHETLVFSHHATAEEFFDALETAKGERLLYQVEENFASVTDLLGHTTNTPHGSLIHFSPGNTALLENIPKHEFAIFAHDVAEALGLNNN
jgi:uncharacterized damage-inducible protein DinB